MPNEEWLTANNGTTNCEKAVLHHQRLTLNQRFFI